MSAAVCLSHSRVEDGIDSEGTGKCEGTGRNRFGGAVIGRVVGRMSRVVRFGLAMGIALSLSQLGVAQSLAQEDEQDQQQDQPTSGRPSYSEGESTLPHMRPLSSETERKYHIGLSGGLSSPEGNSQENPVYGINVGFQLFVPVSMQIEAMTANFSRANQSDRQRTSVLVRGNYNFGGTIPVIRSSYVGLGLGPVFTGSDLELGASPIAGFDIPLTRAPRNYLTLGLSVSYLITAGDTPDSFIGTANLKYWY